MIGVYTNKGGWNEPMGMGNFGPGKLCTVASMEES
jgi:hypothetical protein